ncbi:MAG: ATP-binding cassette domain-containing protein [Nitrososphaerota archaeon]|nr:ATP-binding cassette domain-containing protein [Nitrososphaerota archaeon]MDG6945939.1 ATP-binding cassette domain-containing protein [Nitrososphaerota archaeon]
MSIEVEKGEFILVAGQSGCGKSTLIKCLNGLIPHRYIGRYAREVKTSGQVVEESNLLELGLRVGTVMQEVEKRVVSPVVEDEIAFPGANAHLIVRYWFFTVTVERTSATGAAILKLLAVAVATITMVLTTDPSLYGPSLAKACTPYKGAYVFDLAMRYLQAYVNDLETTLNAQMAQDCRTKG